MSVQYCYEGPAAADVVTVIVVCCASLSIGKCNRDCDCPERNRRHSRQRNNNNNNNSDHRHNGNIRGTCCRSRKDAVAVKSIAFRCILQPIREKPRRAGGSAESTTVCCRRCRDPASDSAQTRRRRSLFHFPVHPENRPSHLQHIHRDRSSRDGAHPKGNPPYHAQCRHDQKVKLASGAFFAGTNSQVHPYTNFHNNSLVSLCPFPSGPSFPSFFSNDTTVATSSQNTFVAQRTTPNSSPSCSQGKSTHSTCARHPPSAQTVIPTRTNNVAAQGPHYLRNRRRHPRPSDRVLRPSLRTRGGVHEFFVFRGRRGVR
mmetsp:Transcript_2872/g.6155  ORF Transcript_2872/g.6155 Transcript_2872/m.6155 type:complete len:315 (-) Transcript_2872:108-1052(-)